MQHMVQTQQQHQEPPQQYRIGDLSNMRGRRVFQEVDLNLICVGFYSFQYKLGYLCVFPCAPRFKLRGGRVLFIARGANWGPANYKGASRRISCSRQFLDLSRCSLDLWCSVLCISLPPPRGLLLSEVIFWSLQS